MALTSSEADESFTNAYANGAFIFTPNFGHDTIADLGAHLSGAKHDTLFFSSELFSDFNALYAATSFDSLGALITVDPMNTLRLGGVTSDLMLANQSDFQFI